MRPCSVVFGRDLSHPAQRLQKMNETTTLQEPPAVSVCISPTFPPPLSSQRWLAPGEKSLLVPLDTTEYWNPHLELLYVLFQSGLRLSGYLLLLYPTESEVQLIYPSKPVPCNRNDSCRALLLAGGKELCVWSPFWAKSTAAGRSER